MGNLELGLFSDSVPMCLGPYACSVRGSCSFLRLSEYFICMPARLQNSGKGLEQKQKIFDLGAVLKYGKKIYGFRRKRKQYENYINVEIRKL